MMVAGIVGWPVTHSLSPRLHAFWLRTHGIDGAYLPLPVERPDFSTAIRGLMAAGFSGVNVTVPHKQAAFALAETWDDAALAAGAANLLLFRNGRIDVRNTDIEGLRTSLAEALGAAALRGKAAIVLGAGGAARAAVIALEQLGVARIDVLGRTASKARALATARTEKTALVGSGLESWSQCAPGAQLVINATSAGLSGTPSPDVSLELLPSGAAVCDLVYNPLETPLLARARQRGIVTIDGLGMLMHQAVPAFAAFYGTRPNVTSALRAELEDALAS